MIIIIVWYCIKVLIGVIKFTDKVHLMSFNYMVQNLQLLVIKLITQIQIRKVYFALLIQYNYTHVYNK